jgi:hypothetical protein
LVIAHNFRRLFFRCIGDTEEATLKVWSVLRGGFRGLAPLRAGRSLTHAYFGVDLAMQAGAQMTLVVVQGVYHGYVLQRTGLKASLYGTVYKAVPSVDIVESINLLNRNDVLLGEICALLNAPVDAKGAPLYAITPALINTSRKFVTVWCSLDMSHYVSSDLNTLVREKLDKVYFNDVFQAPSFDQILAFLKYVQTGDRNHIEKYPSYVMNGWFIETDRVTVGLAMFGPRAPSCNYGSSKQLSFTMPADLNAEDPNLKLGEDKKRAALKYLPFSFEPLSTARVQWNNLFKTGTLCIPEGRKGKNEFTNGQKATLKIGGDPYFTNIYRIIKEVSVNTRAALSAGKRGRQDDDAEDRANVKKRKADTAAVAAFF